MERPARPRVFTVPPAGGGMRLDRFLARWFGDYSRTALARGVRAGLVCEPGGRVLRASATVRGGQVLHLFLPGLAPGTEPPPFPPIVYEDDRIAILDKPAGMLTHPTGNDFAWSVVGLAKERWKEADLVHRIDRDTSGLLLLAKDPATNRILKRAFLEGGVVKEYEAIVKGVPPWESARFDGPIGAAGGPIRIQMAVRPDGLPSLTEVTVIAANPEANLARVRCRLHTGRTHQIRVHLAHAGFPLLGDRMYGVPPDVFLAAWEHGVDPEVVRAAGAPRQALHSARMALDHPGGGRVDVSADPPEDMRRWWERPDVLPLDRPDPEVSTSE